MEEVKDIVFLTLTLGWKNEKWPSGPTELDLEAAKLVTFCAKYFVLLFKILFLVLCCLPIHITTRQARQQIWLVSTLAPTARKHLSTRNILTKPATNYRVSATFSCVCTNCTHHPSGKVVCLNNVMLTTPSSRVGHFGTPDQKLLYQWIQEGEA